MSNLSNAFKFLAVRTELTELIKYEGWLKDEIANWAVEYDKHRDGTDVKSITVIAEAEMQVAALTELLKVCQIEIAERVGKVIHS